MKHWINNGDIEKQIDDGCPIPDGFVLGRRKLSVKELQAKNDRWLLAMSKKSEEDLAASNKKRSNSCKSTFSKLSEEKKVELINKRKSTYYSHDEEWYKLHRLNISIATQGKNIGKIPWNKGFSKETDDRLAKQADACREGILNFIDSKRLSDPTYYLRWRESINDTMSLNQTFNSSTKEDAYYLELVESFGKEDVIRYYSDSRYPYKCDFYIPSQDLFIELNAHWTHGGCPYISTDANCQKLLEDWQNRARSSKYYANAIYTWTDLDVRKRKIAMQNSLNYKVIY